MTIHAVSRAPALIGGCIAAFAWGLTGSFIKLLPAFSTIEILSVRILLAAAVTLALFGFRPALCSEALGLLRQPVGFVLSSIMVFYYLFAVRAFQLAPVSDVTLMVGLSPMIALVVKVLSKQTLALAEALGAAIAFGGLILFVVPKLQGFAGDRTAYLMGLFFSFLAACLSLSYAALFKQYSSQHALSPIVVSCATFTLGSVVMTPVAIATSADLIAKLLHPSSLMIVLGLSILSTVIPTFCYSYAAKHLPPVLTTTLNLLVPIFAAVLAFFLLGETIPGISLLGAMFIIVGILVLSTAKPRALA